MRLSDFLKEKGPIFVLQLPQEGAAKRMTETTGYEAQTIHRLLELNGIPDESNRENHGAAF